MGTFETLRKDMKIYETLCKLMKQKNAKKIFKKN